MASITLPSNSKTIGNTSHTSDHNLIVNAITAVNDESTALAKGISTVNVQTGTSYTLVLSDAGKTIELNNASPITLTIPLHVNVAFPVRTRIDIIQTGAGQVTVANGGTTLNSASGATKIVNQWSAATLIKRGDDTWLLIGQIAL